jgi:hypothetical protein
MFSVRSYLRERRAPRVLAALAAALVASVVPATAHAAEKGVVSEITWGGVNSTTQDRDAAAAADLGAKWVRLHVSWAEGEPNRGSYSASALSRFDRGISLSRQNGAKVLVMVHQSPSWARDSSSVNSPPRDVADYARFVAYLANRWKGQVSAYEIWNEPNVGSYRVAPQQYGSMLKAAGPAIRAADPSARVLTGGLYTNDYDYLDAVFASTPDVGAYFDVIGAHPYVWNIPPAEYWRRGDGRMTSNSFSAYRELRNTVRARGGGDKPVWITEMGWATTSTGASWGVSPDQQASLLTQAYHCLEQDPFVEVAMTYNLRNNWFAGDAEDWDSQLGLMRSDWSPKPAYGAFKAYNPGGGGCTYREVGGSATGAGSTFGNAATAASSVSTSASTATRKLSLVLRVRKARMARRAKVAARGGLISVTGRLANRKSSRLRLTFERRGPSGYRVATRVTVPVSSKGTFSKLVRVRVSGRWRVRATLPKTATRAASVSRYVYVTV